MTDRPTKVERLVRWNQFREELAEGALRDAVHEESKARDEHARAESHVEQVGAWKTRSQSPAGLDLALYEAALDLEQRAMERAGELQAALQVQEQQTRQAKDVLLEAASMTRVSENRNRREQSARELEAEKRIFDQVSDLWLNNREVSP